MKLILVGFLCVLATLIGADIIDKKSIKVHGMIECHLTDPGSSGEWEPPRKATIELWDYFKIFSDKKLHTVEIENTKEYEFEWKDTKILGVKPYLKIYGECSNGFTFDEKYDHTDATKVFGTIIEQDVEIEAGR